MTKWIIWNRDFFHDTNWIWNLQILSKTQESNICTRKWWLLRILFRRLLQLKMLKSSFLPKALSICKRNLKVVEWKEWLSKQLQLSEILLSGSFRFTKTTVTLRFRRNSIWELGQSLINRKHIPLRFSLSVVYSGINSLSKHCMQTLTQKITISLKQKTVSFFHFLSPFLYVFLSYFPVIHRKKAFFRFTKT